MNYLEGKRCYLSGPIESADPRDEDWRIYPKKQLKRRFKLDLFYPSQDPKQQWWTVLREAKKTQDYNQMATIAKLFVRKDLAMVDRADLVIAYVPYQIPTTGVVHEVINSNNCKKPTLLVTDRDDIAFIPVWYFGFIPTEFMFPNWKALFAYLKEVNAGKHKDNDRWSFIYGDI